MKIFISILICIWGCQGIKTQTAEDIYDLGFRTIHSKSSPWGGSYLALHHPEIDHSLFINGKHPLKCSSLKLLPKGKVYMPFFSQFAQQIFIPGDFDEVKFVLNSKCSKMMNAQFRVHRFDESKSLLSSDTISINSTDDWSESSLKVSGKGVNMFYVNIRIEFNKDVKRKIDSTSIYLDRLQILVDGKDINSLDFSSFILKDDAFPEYLPWQAGLTKKFSDKKILGLAETIHSDSLINSIEFEMIKHQVKSGRCKFLVLELHSEVLLFWNLYIHGHKSVKLEELLEESKENSFNNDVTADLLSFLRRYNDTTEQKVYIAGMDRNLPTYGKHFSRFVNSVFENSPNLFLDTISTFLSERKLNEALHLLETEIDFTDVLDPTITALFFQSLKQSIEYPATSYIFYFLNDREKIMSGHLFEIVDSLLPPDKQVVVMGHWIHLNKIAAINRMQKSCGSFLKDRYGDDYGVIGIHKGESSFIAGYGLKKKRFFLDIPESPFVLENYGSNNLKNKMLYFLTEPLIHPIWFRWSGADGDKARIESVVLEERVDAFLWME